MGQWNDRAEGPVPGLVLSAAAMLLATAGAGAFLTIGGDLHDIAGQAGSQSLSMARTTLEVRSVVGRIVGGGSSINAVNTTASLGPGSDPVALDKLIVELTNRTRMVTLTRGDAAGAGVFTVAAVRDSDGSVTGASRFVNADDLVTLDVDTAAGANNLLLPTREPLRIVLMPDPGAPHKVELVTPPTYAGKTIITLR